MLDDLDADEVERYRALLGSRLRREDVLSGRGLYRDRGPRMGVTWAGVLLFGREPSRFYPNAYVRVIRYQGSQPQTGARMNVLRDEIVEGPIPMVIERAKDLLPGLMTSLTRLAASGRFERVPEYPEAAWLEAIINALTHRSHALLGDHIRVTFFDDRMEVESPGRLPGLVRPDNIRTTRYSRNPRIARVLAELGYVRELGEAVDRMFDEMAALGLPAPEFQQAAASVTVTLYNNRRERQRQIVVEAVPNQMRPVIDALLAHGRLTTSETASLLGVSRPTATRYLAHLRERGLVDRIGSGPHDPTAYWRLRGRGPEEGS